VPGISGSIPVSNLDDGIVKITVIQESSSIPNGALVRGNWWYWSIWNNKHICY
jgi:hypothetical protein